MGYRAADFDLPPRPELHVWGAGQIAVDIIVGVGKGAKELQADKPNQATIIEIKIFLLLGFSSDTYILILPPILTLYYR